MFVIHLEINRFHCLNPRLLKDALPDFLPHLIPIRNFLKEHGKPNPHGRIQEPFSFVGTQYSLHTLGDFLHPIHPNQFPALIKGQIIVYESERLHGITPTMTASFRSWIR
ncbi:hypothetical protein EEL32_15015 [Brevibacillus laterosporus]|nr:hypothetical protein EEL32_15015 [Brevibacillus laterosporus]